MCYGNHDFSIALKKFYLKLSIDEEEDISENESRKVRKKKKAKKNKEGKGSKRRSRREVNFVNV